jgi:hypothetical protein
MRLSHLITVKITSMTELNITPDSSNAFGMVKAPVPTIRLKM